jgi:hypothetical protein
MTWIYGIHNIPTWHLPLLLTPWRTYVLINPACYPPPPLSGSIYPAALVAPSDSFKDTGHFLTPEKRKKINNAILYKIRDSGYSHMSAGKLKQDKISKFTMESYSFSYTIGPVSTPLAF